MRHDDTTGLGWFALIAWLLVFPQIVETIYSPALTDIARAFKVGPPLAAQTLSCYFVAFACGVLVWGWLSDRCGRRPTMLAGLAVYAAASCGALLAGSFAALLIARICAAFGAAVGSVVTQTMMRDRLHGRALSQVFSLIGVALAVSPTIGLLCGSLLTQEFGYRGVFLGLLLLASGLLGCSAFGLIETRPEALRVPPLWRTAWRMAGDPQIWLACLLIASFNVSLFSYYALAPFLFARLGSGEAALACGGVALSAGSLLGARINAALLKREVSPAVVLSAGLLLNAIGAVLVWLLQPGWLFIPAMMLVAAAFAMIIPLVLSNALGAYADRRGSAGALLGLAYYVLIGGGLALAGWSQDLGRTLMVCAMTAMSCGALYARFLPFGPKPIMEAQSEPAG